VGADVCRKRKLEGAVLLGSALGLGMPWACGARTGLSATEEQPAEAGATALNDGSPEVLADEGMPVDKFVPDVSELDRLPEEDSAMSDVSLPLIDAGAGVGDPASSCPDAAPPFAYVVTTQSNLYRFDPATTRFTLVGPLECSTPSTGWGPFSMAVDRQGIAYVLWVDSRFQPTQSTLYRVDTATAGRTALSAPAPPSNFLTFGMGFARSPDRKTDVLYAASDTLDPQEAGTLAWIVIPGFQFHAIAPFSPGLVHDAELAGTRDGRLFAFYAIDQGLSSAIAEIDATSARVIAVDKLNSLPLAGSANGVPIGGWAFLSWAGVFYLFTTSPSGGGSIVTRFDPVDRSQVLVGALPEFVVGAGLSTVSSRRIPS
jgi:hypothetical protein